MKFLFALLFVGIIQSGFSTDISFVVYYSKGNVHKTISKTILKKGDQLFLNDIILLGEGTNLILICNNYKGIQLSKKGNYAVKDLLTKCDQNQASYSSSYFKYVWNDLTHPHGKPEEDPEEYMKNVGAVSRGCNEVATGIKIDTLHYFSGPLPVYWVSVYQHSYATVFDRLYDGEAFIKMPLTKGKPIAFDELLKQLQPGEYYWSVTNGEGSGCERDFLKLWDKDAYKNEVNRILKEVPVTGAAETAFARAFLLEENYFMAEALKYYQQAVRFSPNSEVYKRSLNKFYETNF
jgi:hypothetical protein